jgi:hypothetical protein
MNNQALYGLLARFDDPATLITAIERLHQEGHGRLEAFAPYPVEGLAAAQGAHSRKLTPLTLLLALLGAAGTYWMLWYSAVIDYPFVVGGKPLHSVPPFLLIAFVVAILGAVVAAFVGLLMGNRLPRPYHPAFNVAMFEQASDDAFFLLVELEETQGNIEALWQRLKALGADKVQEVPA